MRMLLFVSISLIVLISGCADSDSKVTQPDGANIADETSVSGDEGVSVDVGAETGKLDVDVDADGVSVDVGEDGVSVDVDDE